MEMGPFKKRSLSDEIKEYLYDYIKAMDLKKNTKLPPEETVAKRLGVSRVTIRKALSELEQEGVIFRVHGRGTFVNREALEIKVNINTGYEIKHLIKSSGYRARMEIANLEIKDAGYKMGEKLQIASDELVVRIERIFYADDNPAVLCIDMFPCKLSKEVASKDNIQVSTFDFLRDYAGIVIEWDKTEIRTISKEGYKASNYIDYMENDSFLELQSVNFDRENEPVLCVTEIIDTKYIRFNLIRHKSGIYDKED